MLARVPAVIDVLGALAGLIDTCIVVRDETNSQPVYRQEIVEATEVDTVYMSLSNIGWDNVPHPMKRVYFWMQPDTKKRAEWKLIGAAESDHHCPWR